MQSQVVFYVDMQGKGKSPLPLHSIPKTNNNSKTKSNNKTKTKNKIKVVYTEDLTHPGTAVLLHLSPAPVAETAHHQRDRALLRGSATPDPAHGVLCERRKCGPHYLLHLPEIQSGMENPHPLRIYTSSLTSPSVDISFDFGRSSASNVFPLTFF